MSEIKGTRALELWCKRLVKDCPDVRIENMTTSWRNGLAFCALVHHFRPELIDMSKLKPENIYENNQLAFSIAEKHLGIPALLDPEDMVENDVPDRLSVLTYLSQFYQRLGHTVNTKVSESENKTTVIETLQSVSQISAPLKFGKTGLDKCTACGLPVYLAQRLMVSHKLYHRRCFRCSKCSGHLNPKNHDILEGSEFTCDSCKNEKNLLKYLNNNDCDQMGMLAFGDSSPDAKVDIPKDDVIPKAKPRTSILEKINMFEQNSDKDTHINSKISKLSLKDNVDSRINELKDISGMECERSEVAESKHMPDKNDDNNIDVGSDKHKNSPDKVYKSNIDKFNFLQTQLTGDSLSDKTVDLEVNETKHKVEDCITNTETVIERVNLNEKEDKSCLEEVKEDKNITDDIRISKIPSIKEPDVVEDTKVDINEEIKISVPPRRKKLAANEKVKNKVSEIETKVYPDHLNPFGTDDEEETNEQKVESTPKSNSGQTLKKESTNPFGSSDEEDDEVPPIQPSPKVPGIDNSTPVRRLIAVNPFWSDGEEPSSDEDINSRNSSTYTSMATSTPNLRGSTPQRKKLRAPPPPALLVTDHSHASTDDVASISSLSSLNSTAHSDQKPFERTPLMKKKRPAPTPPESLSAMSECGGSLEKGVDLSDLKNASGSEGGSRRLKGPAPGLPLPERREVKLQMSPEELQVQLDLLETQQLGLERQGVLIERMIRDKCEGDEACTAPQEEVEDLVIQLCELVNEKNDLFRKQTELMYIRRQQRLEQEQADIEHEIRIIQSRPAVNRIDADKAREEQLVSRLVEIVRMRDELVQQIDAERRRERQEDLAIAASIASKRAQRNSDSNTSMKSAEVSTTHKKSKVKDKVKKQLKKAKHSLISKKKDDSSEKKEDKIEKEKDKKSKN